jgi:hypothetical protein
MPAMWKRTVLTIALAMGATTLGCDFVDSMKGMAEGAKELGKHLPNDLKAELTDDKIDKVVEVTPELMEFSEKAKVKWKVDPSTNDIRELATAVGALSDYIAFFESRDTRVTTYYVDVIKIHDAIVQIEWDAGHQDAIERLDKERKELEAKKTGGDASTIDKELKRNRLAREKLDKMKPETPSRRSEPKPPYTLSDEEVQRVRDKKDEVYAAFRKAGYMKDVDGEAGKAK